LKKIRFKVLVEELNQVNSARFCMVQGWCMYTREIGPI